MKKFYKQTRLYTMALVTILFSLQTAFAALALYDTFDAFNTDVWHTADGWANGSPFNNTWRADCVEFSGSEMHLRIDIDDQEGDYPYKAGEYRTNNSDFGYGLYEVNMKCGVGSGTVSGSFFMFNWDPWDEIDIEFLGKDPTLVQFNHYTNGVGGHERIHNLGFDASQDFHTYAFEWLPGVINYYIDGDLVHTTTDNVPTNPGQIMMNTWPGNVRTKKWLGTFNPDILPVYAHYDWVSFTPDNGGGSGGSEDLPPAAPVGFTVSTRGPGTLSLDWFDNTEPDLAGYRIYEATTSGGPYTIIGEQPAGDSWYKLSNVPSGVIFYYIVTAVDIAGNESEPTPEKSGRAK
jgi:hypothetical protein